MRERRGWKVMLCTRLVQLTHAVFVSPLTGVIRPTWRDRFSSVSTLSTAVEDNPVLNVSRAGWSHFTSLWISAQWPSQCMSYEVWLESSETVSVVHERSAVQLCAHSRFKQLPVCKYYIVWSSSAPELCMFLCALYMHNRSSTVLETMKTSKNKP